MIFKSILVKIKSQFMLCSSMQLTFVAVHENKISLTLLHLLYDLMREINQGN